MGYRLVRALARFLVNLFYRHVVTVGLERIPAGGPLILTANHQNALIDPMLILTATARRLVTLAKAPLFRNPLFGPSSASRGRCRSSAGASWRGGVRSWTSSPHSPDPCPNRSCRANRPAGKGKPRGWRGERGAPRRGAATRPQGTGARKGGSPSLALAVTDTRPCARE